MADEIEYASVEVMRGVRDQVNRQVWLMVSNKVWNEGEDARDQVSVQVYDLVYTPVMLTV